MESAFGIDHGEVSKAFGPTVRRAADKVMGTGGELGGIHAGSRGGRAKKTWLTPQPGKHKKHNTIYKPGAATYRP